MTPDLPPVVPGSAIGIIPNPMSGRDIRRIISQASVFPNTEKTSMVLRIIRAAGGLGVERVLMSTDSFGIAAGVLREMNRLANARSTAHIRWPQVEFLELPTPTGTAADTREFAAIMAKRCSAAIVLLGGDGTMRAAAPALGDTPMLALSTGTNNAFPVMLEATVAGLALGLVATGAAAAPTERAKLLHVDVIRADGSTVHEVALVDVCVNTLGDIGSRAVWQISTLRELYCTFAEPHAIGLSAIPARVRPTGRDADRGVAVTLTDPAAAAHTVLAPIAPGLIETVGIGSARALELGVAEQVRLDRGTVALDGEREIEFSPGDRVSVTLARDGPRVIDVPTLLAQHADITSARSLSTT
ncbi:MAG TPA: NAD(+)/NADH kinase [Aldersonia sp.]